MASRGWSGDDVGTLSCAVSTTSARATASCLRWHHRFPIHLASGSASPPRCPHSIGRAAFARLSTALHPWSAPLGLWHLQAAADATVAQLPVVNPPADDDTSEAAEALRALEAAYAAGE